MFRVQNEKQELLKEFDTRVEAYHYAESLANGNAIGYNIEEKLFTVNLRLPSRLDNPIKYDK